MKDFAAIDFETANTERSSVCSVGIVVYKDGKKVDEFYSLIKPEPEYYNYWCSQVHGLTAEDTDNAPAIFGSMLLSSLTFGNRLNQRLLDSPLWLTIKPLMKAA